MPRIGHQAPLHPTLPAADQWQGRALHPVGLARVGLRLYLPKLPTPGRCHEILATPLQLAPPSPGHRPTCTHLPPPPRWIQPLDTFQLNPPLGLPPPSI